MPGLGSEHGFRHEALLYSGDHEFVDRTVAFIRDGLADGDAVLTVVDARKIERLRAALGRDAAPVEFADMAGVGRNPALIIQVWRDFVSANAASGRRVRGIGEPISPARSQAALFECHVHESLLNLAVDPDTDFWLLCPYDTATLPGACIGEAIGAHPFVSEHGACRKNEGMTADYSRYFGAPLRPPVGPVQSVEFDRDSLQTLRRFVAATASAAGVDSERVAGLAVSVSEIATNAIVHGKGCGRAVLWSEGQEVLCEIQGPGRITDPLVGRIRPCAGQVNGYGLWLANQFCDLVQIRSTDSGTTVRLHVHRNGRASALS